MSCVRDHTGSNLLQGLGAAVSSPPGDPDRGCWTTLVAYRIPASATVRRLRRAAATDG